VCLCLAGQAGTGRSSTYNVSILYLISMGFLIPGRSWCRSVFVLAQVEAPYTVQFIYSVYDLYGFFNTCPQSLSPNLRGYVPQTFLCEPIGAKEMFCTFFLIP
jgi:hypothetical protein